MLFVRTFDDKLVNLANKDIYVQPFYRDKDECYGVWARGPATASFELYDAYVLYEGTESQCSRFVEYLSMKLAGHVINGRIEIPADAPVEAVGDDLRSQLAPFVNTKIG